MNFLLEPELLLKIQDPITLCTLMEDTDLRLEIDLTEQFSSYYAQGSGCIPSWLRGTFIRNCPILVRDKFGSHVGHYFDGPAMLFSFVIKDSRVSFSNKYLRSIAFEKVVHEETINFPGFDSYSKLSVFQKSWKYLFADTSSDIIQNANVNIWKFGAHIVALTETPLPVRFEPTTLKTLGNLSYEDHLPKESCWECAHPHLDPSSGDTLNYLVEFGYQSYYVVYKVAAASIAREVLARIPVDKPSYMHDFSVTERFIILVENPLVASAFDFVIRDCGFIHHYNWESERESTFIIIDKTSGSVVSRIKAPSFFCFHHVNAYESEEDVVIDLVEYPDHSIIEAARDKIGVWAQSESITPTLVRYRLSQVDLSATKEVVQSDIEFPRVNDSYGGKPYRYVYAVDDHSEGEEPDVSRSVCKIDLVTKSRVTWREAGCVCDEPVFVAAPAAEQEDEGIVFNIVSNTLRRTSFLLILEASSFTELARVPLPMMVPRGLHGRFFENIVL